MHLAKYIDHTLLKATATESAIIQLCNEAKQYHFYAVCVNSCYVALCKKNVENSDVKIASVVGFPLGAMDTLSKCYEAETAIKHGADEIDMVINIGFLKDQKYDLVEGEIRLIKQRIGDKILKVIIETCYLSEDEIRMASVLAVNAGADFVKTSTGFGSGGAEIKGVQIIKETIKNKAAIKASGGIRDFETALQYIHLGVTRIGTSNGIAIVTGQKGNEQIY
ncbi:MAG TPA: deoxyribose-phosphate aldolase [Chitinophagales bacterium]|nr:deoxyribose-phosphate aldolase [Chitinophagales bacterium]HNM31226.1 deoxyribose-phosphate aldolase [Chitinophagales bacterium]